MWGIWGGGEGRWVGGEGGGLGGIEGTPNVLRVLASNHVRHSLTEDIQQTLNI